MLKSEIPAFLYRLNVSVYQTGKIVNRETKVKEFDFFKCESLTQEQREAIKAAIKGVQFMNASPQYAPENKRPVICVPVGRV